MKREVLILALLLFGMNLSLWVHGVIGTSDITEAYPSLPSGLKNPNKIDQNHLSLTDSNNTVVSSNTGGNFFTAVLDFVESIPVLGSLITLFRFAFDFALNATFGVTFLALKLQLPNIYIAFIGALNFAIVSLGLLELVLNFTAARGGVK